MDLCSFTDAKSGCCDLRTSWSWKYSTTGACDEPSGQTENSEPVTTKYRRNIVILNSSLPSCNAVGCNGSAMLHGPQTQMSVDKSCIPHPVWDGTANLAVRWKRCHWKKRGAPRLKVSLRSQLPGGNLYEFGLQMQCLVCNDSWCLWDRLILQW